MRWLNAHCHLELSHLKGRLRGNRSFPEWLADIVRLKLASTPEQSTAGAAAALRRVKETGTTALLDILSMDTADESLAEATNDGWLRAIRFREVAGFSPNEAQLRLDGAILRQQNSPPESDTNRHGLSPHAPYTTTAPLLQAAAMRAREKNQWLCIHAAEVPEETEMLLRGSGPMMDFLHRWLPTGWKPPGRRPIEWLAEQGCLGPKTLLAHCNDITDGDISLIQRSGAAVVVCPGCHVYFGREAFPLVRLLEAGIPTFLGTDSLASNEDLDMAREVDIAFDLCEGKVAKDRLERLCSADRAAWFFASRPT